MKRRRVSGSRVVLGVLLAGGALGAIFYWNHAAVRGVPATATASPAPLNPASSSPPAPSPTSSTVTTPAASGAVAAGPTTAPSTRPAVAALPSANVAALIAQANQLASEGKPVEARKLLNDPLVEGKLGEADEAAVKEVLRKLNAVLLFSPQRAEGDAYTETITIKPGDRLTKIANTFFVPHETLLRINGLDSDRKIRVGQQLKMIRGPFHAVVSKSKFTLDLYLGAAGGPGSLYVTTYRVGLGTDNSTPTGLWMVEKGNKLKNPTYYSPRGEGVIQAGDPSNPLGPFWIGLTGVEGTAVGKTSYGIHGTIHPDSIGKMSSMGCIRLHNEEIAEVFLLLYEVKSSVRVVD